MQFITTKVHIYQGERDLQDENRDLAIPGGFQVHKEIAMSPGQLSSVRNSFNTTLENCNVIVRQMFSSNLF